MDSEVYDRLELRQKRKDEVMDAKYKPVGWMVENCGIVVPSTSRTTKRAVITDCFAHPKIYERGRRKSVFRLVRSYVRTN